MVVDVIGLVDEGLGNSAYVVDLGDGGGLVVDPERDPRPYLGELDRRGLVPRFVVETHLHADFVSGGRELVQAGGTLMAGGVARPDLLSAEQTEPLARAAYRSIRQRLLALPDELVVYPTHGGGSFGSVAGGGQRTTTIGTERVSNPLLIGDPDEDTFVARLLGGLGTYPPYFLELRDVNRAGPDVHGPTPPALAQLDLEAFDTAVADGAEIVDVRQIGPFAAGHVPGSLSNPWRAQFATWLGWLVERTRPVVFIADDTVERHDLVWAALTVGFEHLAGELVGGVDTWRDAGRTLAATPLVHAAGADGRQVLDIRQTSEFAAGHVPGAAHVELGSLAGSADGVPDTSLLVHCGHGERAMSAASLLERAGYTDVAVLVGGPDELGQLETGADA